MNFFDAVDDPLVAVQHRRGGHLGGVGTGARFGQPVAAEDFAARDRAQILLLLLFGAVPVHGEVVQTVADAHDDAAGSARLGNLDHGQDIADIVHAGSAVFLRNGDPHQPQFTHLGDDLSGMAMGAVEFGRNWLDFALGKLPGHILDHFLFFGQFKIHESSSTWMIDGSQTCISWFSTTYRHAVHNRHDLTVVH